MIDRRSGLVLQYSASKSIKCTDIIKLAKHTWESKQKCRHAEVSSVSGNWYPAVLSVPVTGCNLNSNIALLGVNEFNTQ